MPDSRMVADSECAHDQPSLDFGMRQPGFAGFRSAVENSPVMKDRDAPTAGRRLRYRPSFLQLAGLAALGAAALALFWQAVLLLVPLLFPQPVIAGYGVIEIGCEAEAAFFRCEYAIPSPGDGVFHPAVAEGGRVPRGGLIGYIKLPGRRLPCRAPRAGLLTYRSDGREKNIPAAAISADPQGVFAAVWGGRVRQLARRVRRGQTVAFLIDDLDQTLVVKLPGEPRPDAGSRIRIRADGNEIQAMVERVVADRGTAWAIIRTDSFPFSWLGLHSSRIYLILAQLAGTLVPRGYLRERQGKAGVMAMQGDQEEFVPVSVAGANRRYAVVTDLPDGTMLMPR